VTTILVIPDTQVRPSLTERELAHLTWIGRYIVDRRPDVVVHLGDHWDFESLSHWASSKELEGRRYLADVEAGNAAFRQLNGPLFAYNAKRARFKEKQWWPRRILTLGNHEHRLTRCVESDPKLDGFMSLEQLETPGWEVHPFLTPVNVEGIRFAHYWYNPMTGKPYGGQALTRLKNIGHSFVMGHQQTLDIAVRYVDGVGQWGIVAGACYLHDEDYKGPQGNAHFRGVVVLHEVENGDCCPMVVSLDYLCRKYEGVPLAEFMED
jgi:hypothetical protein